MFEFKTFECSARDCKFSGVKRSFAILQLAIDTIWLEIINNCLKTQPFKLIVSKRSKQREVMHDLALPKILLWYGSLNSSCLCCEGICWQETVVTVWNVCVWMLPCKSYRLIGLSIVMGLLVVEAHGETVFFCGRKVTGNMSMKMMVTAGRITALIVMLVER